MFSLKTDASDDEKKTIKMLIPYSAPEKVNCDINCDKKCGAHVMLDHTAVDTNNYLTKNEHNLTISG